MRASRVVISCLRGPARTLLLACLMLSAAACALRTDSDANAARALLDEAIAAAGGAAALAAAPVLAWSGEATVFRGEQRIELGVESTLQPFERARSDTWLLARGRETLRSLDVQGQQGWMTRGSERTPMTQAMLAHERAQYAVYGLMRLLPLREPGVSLERLPDDADGRRGLRVRHPAAPPSDLYFDSQGRLAYLDNIVPQSDGTGSVAQRFSFEGGIEADGVRWPRVLRISHAGEPYFELRLATFRTLGLWSETVAH